MTPLQALTLGAVQGLTEFLPISSSGHLIRVPTLLGWPDQGLAFPVAAPAGGMPYRFVRFVHPAPGARRPPTTSTPRPSARSASVTDMAACVRFAVAVHVLVLLGLEGGGRTSSFIAGSVNTNPVVVRRILGRLRRAGLVVGHTGPSGGFALLREPGRISLAEVYRAVEGKPLIALHEGPNPSCPVGKNVGGVLVSRRAERAMLDALGGLTLASVVSRVRAKAGAALA